VLLVAPKIYQMINEYFSMYNLTFWKKKKKQHPSDQLCQQIRYVIQFLRKRISFNNSVIYWDKNAWLIVCVENTCLNRCCRIYFTIRIGYTANAMYEIVCETIARKFSNFLLSNTFSEWHLWIPAITKRAFLLFIAHEW
jgi:hypothetical protein